MKKPFRLVDGVEVELTAAEIAAIEAESAAYAAQDGERARARLAAAVQAQLDAVARAAGYDNIQSAASYADEPAVARFQSEGRALRAWRSDVWARCYELLGEVERGERELLDEAELLALLPAPPLV